MSTDLEERPAVEVLLDDKNNNNDDLHSTTATDPPMVVSRDCNGILLVHDGAADDDASYVFVVNDPPPHSLHTDPNPTSHESLQVTTPEQLNSNAPTTDNKSLLSEAELEANVNAQCLNYKIDAGEEEIKINVTIAEHVSILGSEVALNEGVTSTFESELHQPDLEVKDDDDDKTKLAEPPMIVGVVEAVESDSNQLTLEEDKDKDQDHANFLDSQLESKEASQIQVTDSVESKFHLPCQGESEILETSKLAASEEAGEEYLAFRIPVAEATESEPHQLNNDGEIEEQSNLVPSAQVSQYTQFTPTQAVNPVLCQPDVGEETGKFPVDELSMHLETENLNSGMPSCRSDDKQVEIEATNGLTSCPVELSVFETEVIINCGEGQKGESVSPIGDLQSSPLHADGYFQQTRLASSPVKLKPETDAKDISAENTEGLSAGPVACADLESQDVEVYVDRDESVSTWSADFVDSETRVTIEGHQSIPAIPEHDLEIDVEATNDFNVSSSNLPADPVDDSESGGGHSSARKGGASSAGTGRLDSLVSNGPIVSGDSKPDRVNDVNSIEDEGDHSVTGGSIGKSICQGEGIEAIDCNESLSPLPEDSTTGSQEGMIVDIDVEKRPFRFLVRIPRYIDDTLKIQIELAQGQVDEKTRNRDDIRSTIQSKRATCGEYRDIFEAARSEERGVREALNAKRREMDSVQSVINRVKNANSIEDIDDRVRNMEHRIEHETVSLKEEKQLIREIKQLKHLREQLSSSLGPELQPNPEERVKVEEHFKFLKQEMESCRNEVIREEGITKAAWKIYFDENEKLKELQAQFRAADDLRQEAYMQLQNLKKQLYEKNKHFRMYKDNVRQAEDYSSAGDKEALQRLCVKQVETIMELWNKNDEFRNEYIRSNTMSTLRRLRTLDGRSLGPDEEPLLLRSILVKKVDSSLASANKIDIPSLPALQQKELVRQDVVSVVKLEEKHFKADSKSDVHLVDIYPRAKVKTITKSAGMENGIVTVSSREDKQQNDKEDKKIVEEKESVRKAEELRKEEEAAKLKEQRRLEEKAKAKEAEERKRRNAQKVQARAELRALKDAELKEKEREKRAKKKERKKEKMEAASGGIDAESTSRIEFTEPEATQELEIKEKSKTVVKRPQKPSAMSKQIKPKVVPPPLRNRGKKRMQHWMWILLVVGVVITLFLVGNIGFSIKYGLPSFDF